MLTLYKVLLVVHDLIDKQAVICMRHFIDFYFNATCKEHTEETLAIMSQSLAEFHAHSAIFAPFSKVSYMEMLNW